MRHLLLRAALLPPLSAGAHELFVSNERDNTISVVDTRTLEVTRSFRAGRRPRSVLLSPDGSRVWVSAEIGGTVTVIDTATREAVATIGFEVRGVPSDLIHPVGMRLTRDGTLAFVALGPANGVAIVDARSFAVLGYLLVGRRVWHLAMTPEEDLLFTTNGVSGDVSVIDVKARRVVRSIKVGRFSWGAAIRAVP